MELGETSQRLSCSFLPWFFRSAPGFPRRAVETMHGRRRFADSAFGRTPRPDNHFQISAGVFTPFFSRTRSEHSVPHGLMAFQDIHFVSDGAHLP